MSDGLPGAMIVVAGCGPAGLTAGGRAGELGARTLLCEKMDKPGIKLRITGNGRCNLTNGTDPEDFMEHFGKNGPFLRQAFTSFFSEDLLTLLGRFGVETIRERGGRIFPASGQASDIVNALIQWNRQVNTGIRSRSKIARLHMESGKITGVSTVVPAAQTDSPFQTSDNPFIPAGAVILATGGASYPGTGSTGDGYRLAQSVGHSLVPIRPALIPIETKGNTALKLQGLALKNVSLSVWVDGSRKAERFGEMLFTHFGVSGPIVLSASQIIVDALREKKPVELMIDLKPALDYQKLDQRLLRDFREHGSMHTKNLLSQLLPAKLIPICLDSVPLDPAKPAHQISADERSRLVQWLKQFRFTVKGHRPLAEAIVTAGGISLKEVNPRTLESRLVKGLYFAGEILDLNADTGGYNLQAAFSTGWLAGESAAAQVLSSKADHPAG